MNISSFISRESSLQLELLGILGTNDHKQERVAKILRCWGVFWVMKLNPQRAPLYGDCVLTVRLTEQTTREDDVVFYLLFAGSTLKHLTSTRKVNSATLETITPGHDCCERVKVSLYASKDGLPVVVAEENFEFVQDEAYDSAQFLAANAGNQQALIFARFLDRSRPPSGDATILDEKITLAFRHLRLPSGWNVLGTDTSRKDGHLQETLMHFAARLGLCRLASFLLQQPGGREALGIHNSEGATPLSLALERGFLKLHHLLTEEEAEGPDFLIEASRVELSEGSHVEHHCGLNVYTLTKKSGADADTSMEENIEELKKYMQRHSQSQGAGVKSEVQPTLETPDDLRCLHPEVEQNPVKDLGSEAILHKDPEDENNVQVFSVEVSQESDCKSEKVEEHGIAFSNRLEAVGGEVAGGEVAMLSSASKEKDIETEEEGHVPIVAAENVSAPNDDLQSSSTEIHSGENLLSGGNPKEETGMTSTGIVLDQESLCERDYTKQEMITARERAAPNTATAEATSETSDLTKDISVNMGQAMSGYCASTASTVDTQSCVESSDGQETDKMVTLENLPGNSDKTSDNYGPCPSLEANTGVQTQEPNCAIESLQTPGSPMTNAMDCKGTSDNVKNGVDGENSQDKYVDNILVESSNVIIEEATPSKAVASNDPQLSKESHPQNPLLCEAATEEAVDLIWKEPAVETKDEDKTIACKDCTNTLPISDSEALKTQAETEFESVVSQHADSTSRTPAAVITEEHEESLAVTEMSSRSCSEKTPSQETDPCYTRVQRAESDNLVGLETAACDSTLVCLPESKVEDFGCSVVEEPQSHVENSGESCVAEVLRDIISALETATSPVKENEQHTQVTGDENAKLPPAGDATSLHNDNDLSVCAGGNRDKVSDTPPLFSNCEHQQNQEVSAEDSVLCDASTEMQEAAVTATCQHRDELQLTTCEHHREDGVLNATHCDTETQGAQEDLVRSLLSQCKQPEGDKTLAVDLEERATPDQNSEQKNGESTVNDGNPGTGVNNEAEIAPPSSLHDILDIKPSWFLAYERKETEEVVMEESLVEYDKDEQDSEGVMVSRASLHPIAEEPLINGDSSSDTASTSSASCSESGDSEKEYIDCSEQTLDSLSPSVDYMSSEEVVTASSLKSPNGVMGTEDGIVTVSELLVNESSDSLKLDVLKEKSVQDTGEAIAALKEEDSGLDLSGTMEEIACPSISDTEIVSESLNGKAVDEVDFVKHLQSSPKTQMINRESCCSVEPCSHANLLESKPENDSTECKRFLEEGLGTEASQQLLGGESAGDSDIFHMSPEVMDDMFTKLEERQSLCDATSSSSSTDDTASLERTSSHGSDTSLPQVLSMKRNKDRHSLDSSCSSTVTASVEERDSEHTGVSEMEGEEMDRITEEPTHLSRSKSSMRSLSPFRRHSWGPGKNHSNDPEINRRSYSLEGLAGDADDKRKAPTTLQASSTRSNKLVGSSPDGEDRGSLVSLTEEEQESDQREIRPFQHQASSERSHLRGFTYPRSAVTSHLTKSMSLVTISQPGMETQRRTQPKRRISFSFSISPLVPKSKHVFSLVSSSSDEESDSSRSSNITSNSLAQSISEESCDLLPQNASRKDFEGKSGTKVSRTFSYLRNKMSSGKKGKEKEKTKEKDKELKDKDKKTLNGHLYSSTPLVGPITCYSCAKNFTTKEGYLCANCNVIVHKACRESSTPCTKGKTMKQSQKVLQSHDSSSLPAVTMRNKGSQPKERPRSAILAPDENTFPALIGNRRPQTTISISKSISTQNIAGLGCDESLSGTWKFLSHSTDSLHKISKVNESLESLIDEGTDMNEGQLMGDFEMDSKQLEAESWSQVVDSKFLRQQKKDVVKRQDVVYELMQTEMHHVRTLKIMSDVYSRGMMTELQFEQHTLEKIFPCLDDLLSIHSQFFQRILERKKEAMVEKSEKNFVIKRIGDILINQFSGENAERMKKTYGKFCGHHNEAVNYFKDLHSKEKRFQAFVKKKMSSAVVRRLGIPECILLVTQRITKYPVLLQRLLQYTKENEAEHEDVTQSLHMIKGVITAVNSKVNNYEKKMRLNEIYNKTDSKSIQRMKSGQMFAKEDLKRRKLVRDGSVFLKSTTGRLKEVLAFLLSDILVFLQEKDQKYVFASLDQKSTVISLKKLIVREVAHEEKGLFLISMGAKDPEMVEVHASSKEERNSWIQIIQDTMNTMNKDEDEGVPSESEEEKRILDTKARELKEQLQKKDQQIIVLLEEKVKIFQGLTDCGGQDESPTSVTCRALFRGSTDEAPRGELVIKSAMKEVETLQSLVTKNMWGNVAQLVGTPTELEAGGVGPVLLPRRAETFGGFDSHQLNASKSGERDEGEDTQDLRRTESDSVLKKGINANLMFKRNSEQVLQTVTSLHGLLSTLQAVVLQQDTYIEDQKLLLSERAITRTNSRPNSLIEQEKQRSLEKQRQELANLQKQQAQHLEEKRRREREWDAREKEIVERESRLAQEEELAVKSHQEMEQDRSELQNRKEEYQHDLERLRTAQRQLEKEQEQLKKDMEKVSCQHDKLSRVPSLPAGTDSAKWFSSSSPKQEHLEADLSVSPKKDSLLRTESKPKGKGHFHLLGTNQPNKSAEGSAPNRLFNLSKPKEKKDKKKKGKSGRSQPTDSQSSEGAALEEEIFC
ncbi:A-kinase anchor protein 13 isoform X6 [Ascaphus truei]|uniref:A-kinase anchor protein 13 isoform X6 n=1 Tax=Ascaphus truei TaxID=8439 RepID=UPI003F5AC7A4